MQYYSRAILAPFAYIVLLKIQKFQSQKLDNSNICVLHAVLLIAL
jgi:hypothetical protein